VAAVTQVVRRERPQAEQRADAGGFHLAIVLGAAQRWPAEGALSREAVRAQEQSPDKTSANGVNTAGPRLRRWLLIEGHFRRRLEIDVRGSFDHGLVAIRFVSATAADGL
jgi:hypothetical protein